MTLLWVGLGVLVVVAGVAYRFRIRSEIGRGGLTDQHIRRILESGSVEMADEPLDMDEIERAEDEFWEEPWDEPEPW